MVEHSIVIKTDLESTDITLFVQHLNHYSDSDIIIQKGVHRINAKSILGMYALEIQKDETVNFVITGEEERIIETIDNFFNNMIER